jgi:hypothetical protein
MNWYYLYLIKRLIKKYLQNLPYPCHLGHPCPFLDHPCLDRPYPYPFLDLPCPYHHHSHLWKNLLPYRSLLYHQHLYHNHLCWMNWYYLYLIKHLIKRYLQNLPYLGHLYLDHPYQVPYQVPFLDPFQLHLGLPYHRDLPYRLGLHDHDHDHDHYQRRQQTFQRLKLLKEDPFYLLFIFKIWYISLI